MGALIQSFGRLEWIANLQGIDASAILHIFSQKESASELQSRFDDQAIPKREFTFSVSVHRSIDHAFVNLHQWKFS
jgi:hypothetical protein